jgi:hypothetical protein
MIWLCKVEYSKTGCHQWLLSGSPFRKLTGRDVSLGDLHERRFSGTENSILKEVRICHSSDTGKILQYLKLPPM